MNPLATYLAELRDIHASGAGVKETSYYTPLANLFDEVGKTLKPKVRAILQLQNQGGEELGTRDNAARVPQYQIAHMDKTCGNT
jgi:hypothetical protein